MKIRLINYLETTHPGGINMIMRDKPKNISDMGHESIVLQPNPANLPEEEIYEGFKIIRISIPRDKYFSSYDVSPGTLAGKIS